MSASLCLPGETWKPIPDFPGYEVSDHGRVRSYHRHAAGYSGTAWEIADTPRRILKGAYKVKGYQFVSLGRDGNCYTRMVHRLALEVFVGPCPDGQEACHNDGNPRNNHLSNLRYDSHVANMQDASEHGTLIGTSKLSEPEVLKLRTDYAEGKPTRQLADELSIAPGTVNNIGVGRNYRHVGGPRTRRQKLTNADARQIRQAVRQGQTRKSQVRKYGVSTSTIGRIMNGKVYRDSTLRETT